MTTAASPPSGSPVRVLDEDDWSGFFATDSVAFGQSLPDGTAEREREILEPDRSIGVFDGSTSVGIATAYSLELSVPGRVLPAAGVSWVGVLPTHRRRGILRALMTHQLHDIHDRGHEPVAILWASEPPIYGRFGYGMASRAYALDVPRGPRALRADAPSDPTLRLRIAPADDWKTTADVYARAVTDRPGMLVRTEPWWRRAVRDLPASRDGRSELRCVLAEDDSGVRGYARYATKPDWSGVGPRGTVHVRELMATDGAARAELYRFLFDQDLMGQTELWNIPVDDPVLLWLDNVRVTRPRLFDALYLRIVDLPGALQARSYALAQDVVLEVTDALCPWNAGRWHLSADSSRVTCEPTEAPADVAIGIAELGAVYLGGIQLRELGLAGRVTEHTPGALAAASIAFQHSPAPWCPIVF